MNIGSLTDLNAKEWFDARRNHRIGRLKTLHIFPVLFLFAVLITPLLASAQATPRLLTPDTVAKGDTVEARIEGATKGAIVTWTWGQGRLSPTTGTTGTTVRFDAILDGTRSKPKAERPLEYWGVDGTKFMIPSVYDNSKGNADTERMMRTIKEEVIWLNEFSSFEQAREKIGRSIGLDYNKLYVHSELGYMRPEEYEALYYEQTLRKTARNLYNFWVPKVS